MLGGLNTSCLLIVLTFFTMLRKKKTLLKDNKSLVRVSLIWFVNIRRIYACSVYKRNNRYTLLQKKVSQALKLIEFSLQCVFGLQSSASHQSKCL